ncbi:MAG: hypothetical protein ABIK90_06855 [candidate division WOR-3 bacterium]
MPNKEGEKGQVVAEIKPGSSHLTVGEAVEIGKEGGVVQVNDGRVVRIVLREDGNNKKND